MKKVALILLISVVCLFATPSAFDGKISGIQVYNSTGYAGINNVVLFTVTPTTGTAKIFVFGIGPESFNLTGNQMLAQLYNSQNSNNKTVRICFDDTVTYPGHNDYYYANCIANLDN